MYPTLSCRPPHQLCCWPAKSASATACNRLCCQLGVIPSSACTPGLCQEGQHGVSRAASHRASRQRLPAEGCHLVLPSTTYSNFRLTKASCMPATACEHPHAILEAVYSGQPTKAVGRRLGFVWVWSRRVDTSVKQSAARAVQQVGSMAGQRGDKLGSREQELMMGPRKCKCGGAHTIAEGEESGGIGLGGSDCLMWGRAWCIRQCQGNGARDLQHHLWPVATGPSTT